MVRPIAEALAQDVTLMDADPIPDDEMLMDVMVVGRIQNTATGETRLYVTKSENTDMIVQAGLVSCLRQVVEGEPWVTWGADEDDDQP